MRRLVLFSAVAAALPAVAYAATPGVIDPSLFTPSASDPSMRWLSAVFPEILSAATNGPTSGVAEVVRFVNSAVMAVGAAFVTYRIAQAIMNSAHHGEVLGQEWSTMWAPLRLFLAVAGMVPLMSGFNLAQVVVLTITSWGVGLANAAWNVAVAGFLLNGTALAPVASPKADDFLAGLLQNLTCEALINAANGEPGRPGNLAVRQVLTLVNGEQQSQYTASWPTGATESVAAVRFIWHPESGGVGQPVCGAVQLPNLVISTPATGPALGNASARYRANMGTALSGQTAAQQAAARNLAMLDEAGFSRTWMTAIASAEQDLSEVARGIAEGIVFRAMPTGPGIDYAAAAQRVSLAREQLRSTIYTEIQRRWQSSSNQLPERLAASMRAGGWVQAGAWHSEIASVQARLYALEDAVPVSTAPTRAGMTTTMNESWGAALTTIEAITDRANLRSLSSQVRGGQLVPGAAGEQKPSDDLFSRLIPGSLDRAISKELQDLTMMSEGDAWTNPIGTMSSLGHRLLGAVTAAGGMAAIGGTVLGGVANVASGGGASMIMQVLAVPVGLFIFALFSGAAYLAYVLPLIPYLIFTVGVIQWFVLVLEAVVSAPLWAFAHLHMKGSDDPVGEAAHTGYRIILSLMLRPLLMVVGMVLGMVAIIVAGGFVASTFFAATRFILGNNNAGLFGWAVFTFLAAVLNGAVCVMCFDLIHKAPDRVLRWLGGATEESETNTHSSRIVGAAIAVGQKAESHMGSVLARKPSRPGRKGTGGIGGGGERT